MAVDAASIDLPASPGVYLFKTAEGRVLYVGKATRLNERIRSYFATNPDRQMIPELVKRADDVITRSPAQHVVSRSPHDRAGCRSIVRGNRPDAEPTVGPVGEAEVFAVCDRCGESVAGSVYVVE